jgi:nucleoside-diphosphate-sugar epimerase
MRVFVAGATGAIGRPLLPRLVAAGHEVTGMTRSEEKAAGVREAGAHAVVCDVFDEQGMRAAMAESEPEVVVHQLTSLPDRFDFRDKDLYRATNRLRGEGTRILLDAAAAAGARRMVAQSIAFIYAPRGGWVKSEDDPALKPEAVGFGEAVATTLEMERAVTGSRELEGLILRYGFFYGPETAYGESGYTVEDVRKRRFPVVGRGTGTFSFIHVDDAAEATVAAVERGDPGVYNVTDDEPAAMKDWLPVFAEAFGAKKPLRAPAWIARLAAGKTAAQFAIQLRGASNAKAKRELAWQPRWPSWREGFRDAPR